MITNLTTTEIEELRIAIAEEMGWKWHYGDCCKTSGACYWNKGKFDYRTAICFTNLPPYTEKIDSIREAAMERFKTPEDVFWFAKEIRIRRHEIGVDEPWQLTALDWSIAFARTAKIWRYKV